MRIKLTLLAIDSLYLVDLYVITWNVLLALKYKVSLVLYIEDIHLPEVSNTCILEVYNILKEINVDINESPCKPGLYGPYSQNARFHIYKFYKERLLKHRTCFHCQCSFKRLAVLKQVNLILGDPIVYDGKCLKRNYKSGKLRLKVPRFGTYMNDYKFNWSCVDMLILWIKSRPTAVLINVIDDWLMRIPYIFNKRNQIANLPEYILINIYLGFPVPKYYHLPLICSAHENKLSKVFISSKLNNMLTLGIVPKAIIRYLISIIVNENWGNVLDASFALKYSKLKRDNIQFNCKQLIIINQICLSEIIADIDTIIITMLGINNAKLAIDFCIKRSILLHDIYNLISFAFWTNVKSKSKSLCNLRYMIFRLLIIEYKKITIWTKASISNIHIKLANYFGINLHMFCTLVAFVLDDKQYISLYDGFILLGKRIIIGRIQLLIDYS